MSREIWMVSLTTLRLKTFDLQRVNDLLKPESPPEKEGNNSAQQRKHFSQKRIRTKTSLNTQRNISEDPLQSQRSVSSLPKTNLPKCGQERAANPFGKMTLF
ncbi:unnamed protein product [Larinioides sclopetarius]|uniref:Uncharacterized protein n=1 Tax=Larinioides sclopetarius TaxID=280406 RepID=A0AAV2B0F6_9ARAC